MMVDNLKSHRDILLNEYDLGEWKAGACEDEVFAAVEEIKAQNKSHMVKKAEIMAYILKNAMIDINPNGIFADKINHCNIIEGIKSEWRGVAEKEQMAETLCKMRQLTEAFVFTGDIDFSHTCPDWQNILKLGVSGLIERIDKKLSMTDPADETYEFYSSSKTVLEAAVFYIKRLANEAKRLSQGNGNMELLYNSLTALSKEPPSTLHEALEMFFIWYMLQYHLDGAIVRSLGGLDTLLYPYYRADIESGRITETDARMMLRYFMIKMNAKKFGNNIPFYLCGADIEGNDLTNPLTHMILEEYEALDVEDPKIHIRCHGGLDKTVIKKVAKLIREGKNSFVFMNDEVVERSLVSLGVSKEDARKYSVVGCYEPCADGEIPCTCAGRLNIPKVLMLTLCDGIDIVSGKRLLPASSRALSSYEALCESFFENLQKVSNCCMELVCEYEKNYKYICPSLIFSAPYDECIERGIEAYSGGARYNNTSVSAFGLATAVDSLAAIKKAVFEDKTVSAEELVDILKSNWENAEALKIKIQNTYPKYGNNHPECDGMARDITNLLAEAINNKPNARGGVFRLGLFSIDWRYPFGEATSATPNGRLLGEALSKNLSATLGADKEGVTALINSACKIDHAKVPDGAVLDLLLHSSAVKGDDGLSALCGIILAYLSMGGMAIQINILNPRTLKEAQKEPERYKNLQVRLCGWNVRFVNLSKTEQDEFIKQAEHMGA